MEYRNVHCLVYPNRIVITLVIQTRNWMMLKPLLLDLRRGRRIPNKQLLQVLEFDDSENFLAPTLKHEAIQTVLAFPNHLSLGQTALKHLNWSLEQWHTVLWTDETWVCPGHHTKIRST